MTATLHILASLAVTLLGILSVSLSVDWNPSTDVLPRWER